MNIDSKLEQAKLIQQGLMEFERDHAPQRGDNELFCKVDGEDWPCERMLLFMLLQAIATMQAMMPSGNIGDIMNKFMGKQ